MNDGEWNVGDWPLQDTHPQIPCLSHIRGKREPDITPEQERLLKEQAATSGASEAEIVREALDEYLSGGSTSFMASQRRDALNRVLELNKEIAEGHRFPDGYKFGRDEIYKVRMARLGPTKSGDQS